jgi:hypothetical protein
MKIAFLILSCLLLWTGVSFSGSLLDEYTKDKEKDIYAKPDYKTSPTIDLHSNKPATTGTGLSNSQFNTPTNPTINNGQQNNSNSIGENPKK